ncbi:arsenate reductase ArsC [Prevotella sp.]|jgi:arsenate reductase|uniref:arsenate reductase ArsC n=1 Tax=Prevotella sp. TaxID=59823 RepID=UPI002649A942|nr:arsenate reductase ArsC [Prevotella sp.]MDN5554123.1 arsenate reductase ArsC [Prevotella sp.]
MKILILCTGNSCRSQIAQGFLQSFDSDLTVCSAGTEPSEKVNDKAVAVMNEVGIDISSAYPKSVNQYLDEEWDYVITVCGGANENCPMFTGHVKHRLHIGFDDPAAITGDEEFVMNEFRRIRNEIKNGFYAFYITEIKQQKLPTCSCND